VGDLGTVLHYDGVIWTRIDHLSESAAGDQAQAAGIDQLDERGGSSNSGAMPPRWLHQQCSPLRC